MGLFRPKGAEIGTYTTTFVYQGPFKKDASTGSRVINEVVLEGRLNISRGLLRLGIDIAHSPDPRAKFLR